MKKLNLPISARQAQKLLARHGEEVPSEIRRRLSIALGCDTHPAVLLRHLDRLAQQDPNQIVLASPKGESSGRTHQVGTDEVAPQSEIPSEESPVHGGDSSSGEVEDGHQGGDPMASDPSVGAHAGNGGSGQSGLGDRPTGPPCPEYPSVGDADANTCEPLRSDGETTAADDSPGVGKPAGADPNGLRTDGQCVIAPAQDMSDNLCHNRDEAHPPKQAASPESDSGGDALTGRANSVFDSEDECPDAKGKEAGETNDGMVSEKYRYRRIRDSRRYRFSARPKHGGITAEMRRVGITPRLVKLARRALARLIEGGESQSGPRWDRKDLAARLITHRPLSPARREEEGRPAILVLADVSDSCAGFSHAALMVSKAISRLGMTGADIAVVSHSNGFPQECLINQGEVIQASSLGQFLDYAWNRSVQGSIAWYEATLSRLNIEAVVAIGDWDAEWLYSSLVRQPSVRRFVWLSNWNCNSQHPGIRQDILKRKSSWGASQLRKATYVVGCKTAEDFLRGLEIALRRVAP